MKKTKKLLSIVLAAILLLSVCAVGFTANAAPGKITLEKLIEADLWISFPLNLEAEMKSKVVDGKDYSDFEAWLDILKQNVLEAIENTSFSIEDDQILIEIESPELIDEVAGIFAEYFGEEYAQKCARFVDLMLKSSKSSSYRYMTVNLLFVGLILPSPVAGLLDNVKYNNQNGVYDDKEWKAFAALRDEYNKLTASETIDEFIDGVTIICDYNEAASALIESSGFIGYIDAFIFSLPGFLQFFFKPFLKVALCIRKMFNWF